MTDATQQDFDWLVPTTKELLRPDEVATFLGRSLNFVYKLKDEGKLEVHAPTGREVERFVITRRSLVLVLAETAKYNPAYFYERVEALLNHLDAAQLSRLITAANSRRAKKLASV